MSVPPPKGPQKTTAASLRMPCGIGDLPPEVLLKIFQFFNVNQLESTISPVCHLWRNLSRRPCLRIQLELEGEGQSTAAACELIRSCPNLKDLSIIYRKDTDCLLHHVASYNHGLRRLAVIECEGSPFKYELSAKILYEVFLRCSHIRDLNIRDSVPCNNSFILDQDVWLPELRRINFSCKSFLGSDELRMIVLRCNKLEEIRVLGILPVPKWCDQDIVLLAQRLCETLKVLKIDCNELSDEAFSALSQCCQLRKLYVDSAVKITDNGVLHLSRLQNLDSLHLTQAGRVSSGGWVRMFSKTLWTQMRELSLSLCTNVSDDTLHQVARACPNLVKLDLSGCTLISDKGLRSVFQSCKMLEYLNIDTAHKHVYRSFPFIASYTRNLKWLLYDECGLEEEIQILKDLGDSLPNLQII